MACPKRKRKRVIRKQKKSKLSPLRNLFLSAPFLKKASQSNLSTIKRIISKASPTEIKALVELFKNLKKFPLTSAEKLPFQQKRKIIRKFINKKTSCAKRKRLCNIQSGGIFPLIPAIASLGISLLTSLLNK